jgi:phosphohistidine phosphatase
MNYQVSGRNGMDLILWRHADAEDGEQGTPDMARELTGKGLKQATRIAAWLKPLLPKDSRILVSPAQRARQTADALRLEYEIADELAPGVDAAEVLAAAGWPDATGTVLVVGHQPTLGRVISLLTIGEEGEFAMKKGAIFWIARRKRGDEAQTELRAVMSPDLLKK